MLFGGPANLARRFARLEKEDPDRSRGEWPDLLLIDGGKGQLSAVCEVLEDAGVHDVPVVGRDTELIALGRLLGSTLAP